MKERKDKKLPEEKDRHLDIPAEANRDKHVNFPSVDGDGDESLEEHPPQEEETVERRKKWAQALDVGKKQRDRP